jgi:glycosyltransferase involved in cell wall biosynthesis
MLFTFAWLVWIRVRGGIDVLHGCNPPDLFWIFGWLIRATGGAYVYDQHEPVPELFEAKFGSSGGLTHAINWILRRLEAASYRTSDAVFTVNESMRALVLGRSQLGPERVEVLWNAPEVAAYRELAIGLAPNGQQIGYVGVMNSQEGLDVLLDAWRMVVGQPDLPDACLHLVGDGEARPDLERLATRLGISESIVFHGFLSASDYIPILARCLLGVSPDPPTAFNQLATMVKVIDYMSIGRGTVAFDLAETVRLAGPAARIVRPATSDALAQALIELLRNPAEAAALGAAATEQIAALSLDWSASGRRLVARYAEIAASLGGRGRRPMPR